MPHRFVLLYLVFWSLLLSNKVAAQPLVTVGALKQVMHQGQLAGQAQLDTLSGEHRYGLGPVAFLRGEILLWNDTAYVSRVTGEQELNAVTAEPTVSAPFLVYASVPAWTQPRSINTAITSLSQLQAQVERQARAAGRSLEEPFPFILQGTAQRVVYHVMNRPEGRTGHDPALHQQAKQFYTLQDEAVQILGFYSRHHQGVFTHRDAYIHAHVINLARTHMGHLDELSAPAKSLAISFPASPTRIDTKRRD